MGTKLIFPDKLSQVCLFNIVLGYKMDLPFLSLSLTHAYTMINAYGHAAQILTLHTLCAAVILHLSTNGARLNHCFFARMCQYCYSLRFAHALNLA